MSAEATEYDRAAREVDVVARIVADALADGEPSHEVEHWAEQYRVARDQRHAASLAYFGKCHRCGQVEERGPRRSAR